MEAESYLETFVQRTPQACVVPRALAGGSRHTRKRPCQRCTDPAESWREGGVPQLIMIAGLPDTQTGQMGENHRLVFFVNTKVKILDKLLASQV